MAENQSRLRLYGKPSTKEAIAQEVAKLFLEGKGATKIQRALDFNSTKTVYNYRDLAIQLGFLELDQSGKPILPAKSKETSFKEFTEKNPFVEYPLIKEWVQDLTYRKQGKPIKTARAYVTRLKGICNTLRVNPSAFLQSLESSETLFKNFLDIYQKGEAKIQYTCKPEFVDMSNVAYSFSKGLRDFMRFHGFSYMRGKAGVMSQKVPNHGKYADIKLKKDELIWCRNWLKENYGNCSDEYRVISMAIQSCSRIEALLNMTLDYEEVKDEQSGEVTFLMTAIESKTEHIKGGKWTKYITWEDTQESILKLKQKGGYKIYESNLIQSKFKEHLKNVIIEMFVKLGKIPNLKELEMKRAQGMKKVGNYYFEKPFHVFRHIGAHYWLEETDYNYVVVAKIGGWHTVDELIKSYGEMPPEKILQIMHNKKGAGAVD